MDEDKQAIATPPRGLCLREALSWLQSVRLHGSQELIAQMLVDSQLADLYTWAFDLPDDWLHVSTGNFKVPDWWIHTPLTAITQIFKEALEALKQARGDDKAKMCIRAFMKQAGTGPNIIISESKGIISEDACCRSDLVALADALSRYAIQFHANVQGSFTNVHHVDAHLRIRMQNGDESAPSFQGRSCRSEGGSGLGATKSFVADAAGAAAAAGELPQPSPLCLSLVSLPPPLPPVCEHECPLPVS